VNGLRNNLRAWGISREHDENILGTHWEQGRKTKNASPPPTPKVETMEASQNRRFYGKMECLSLWPTYIGEKGRTLGKTYGTKARCYWGHPWGTHWEQGKNEKKNPQLPLQNLKEKKPRHFECMLSLLIGCMKFLCSKTVHHHFWPGLIPAL